MGKKKPSIKQFPDPKKIPKHLNVLNEDSEVFWRFNIFDADIIFPKASKEDFPFTKIASTIKSIEQRTWSDIDGKQKRDHPIEIDQLEKFARDRLVALNLEDIDQLWSLRLNGRCRLWGIRDRNIFNILWLDPNHAVCPSYLKHT